MGREGVESGGETGGVGWVDCGLSATGGGGTESGGRLAGDGEHRAAATQRRGHTKRSARGDHVSSILHSLSPGLVNKAM